MKAKHSIYLAAALATSIAAVALAEQKSAGEPAKPSAVVASVEKITAKVTAIDYKARTVTLQAPNGNTVDLVIGPEAKNFDRVKKGDNVAIEYVESVAIVVAPKGAAVPATGQTTYVETAKPGEKPHGRAVQTTTVTATVEAIDHKARTVTLRGPQGKSRTLTVGPEVKQLDKVQKGDQVTVKATVATAIAVNKPAATK